MKKSIRTSIVIAITLAVFVTTFTFNSSAANSYYQYRAVKVKNLTKELSSTPFATTKGQPGITININSGKSVSRTYSYNVNGGVSYEAINAAIGWSKGTTDGVNISNGGSWKVPAKNGSKKVKYGVLKGFFYYDRVEYKIQKRKVSSYHAGRGGTRVTYGKWEDCKTKCIARKVRRNDAVYTKSFIYN